MTDTERSPAVPHSASHPDHGLSAAQVAAGQVNTRHFGSVTMPGHLHSEGASAGIGAFDAGNRHGRSRPGEVSPRAFIVAQMTVERPAEPKGGVAPGTMHGINRGLEGSNPRGRTLKAEVHQSAWADEPRKRCHRRIVSVEVDPGVGPLDGFSLPGAPAASCPLRTQTSGGTTAVFRRPRRRTFDVHPGPVSNRAVTSRHTIGEKATV